jgi:diguanylate cyclase (GGDEF)-like protein
LNWFNNKLFRIFIQIGKLRSIVVLTLAFVIITVVVTTFSIHDTQFKQAITTVIIAIIIPIFILPLILNKLFDLMYIIHFLELQLRERSSAKNLTHILSSKSLNQQITKLYQYNMRHKEAFSILYLGMDNSQSITSTYSVPAKNAAIQKIGEIINDSKRYSDISVRISDEEFAVALPSTNIDGALLVAERIKNQIEILEFKYQDLSIHLTVSIGLSGCENAFLYTLNSLTENAGKAFYEAKSAEKKLY